MMTVVGQHLSPFIHIKNKLMIRNIFKFIFWVAVFIVASYVMLWLLSLLLGFLAFAILAPIQAAILFMILSGGAYLTSKFFKFLRR